MTTAPDGFTALPSVDDLLPAPTTPPIDTEALSAASTPGAILDAVGIAPELVEGISARTPVATIIAIGLLLIGGLGIGGLIVVGALATSLPQEARVALLTTAGTAIVAAITAAATLLTRVHD